LVNASALMESQKVTPNLGMQGTPISVVPLRRRGAGAPDTCRWAALMLNRY